MEKFPTLNNHMYNNFIVKYDFRFVKLKVAKSYVTLYYFPRNNVSTPF